MQVSVQFHVPVALSPGKEPWYPLCRRLGGPRSRPGGSGKDKNLPLLGIELRFFGRPARGLSLCRLSYDVVSWTLRGVMIHAALWEQSFCRMHKTSGVWWQLRAASTAPELMWTLLREETKSTYTDQVLEPLEKLEADGGIALRCVLAKWLLRIWVGVNWLNVASGGELWQWRCWNFGFWYNSG
jgi:hypothetical protein